MSAPLGVCVLYVLIWHLMGSAGCRAARLKSQSASETACYRIGAVICPLPGRRSARELGWTSVFVMPPSLCGFELGAVSQHRMHDDREATGERDPRLAHRRPLGDRECPVLKLQRPLVARQHDVRSLVQECADPPVAALRDAAGIVDLA